MQYCRNDSNFLNYQRHCYNLPASIKYSELQLQLTWNKTETFFNSQRLWMGNIFISEHLECACICVLCDRTMVDIADWMKQDIFVRLSHDYFTKCQILQAMSYRWADEHNTKMFPHEAYWCHNYRHHHTNNAMQCLLLAVKGYLWWWLPGLPSPWPCLCVISPRHPGHWHNPCTRRDLEISSQTSAGRERVARSKSQMQKLSKVNQN